MAMKAVELLLVLLSSVPDEFTASDTHGAEVLHCVHKKCVWRQQAVALVLGSELEGDGLAIVLEYDTRTYMGLTLRRVAGSWVEVSCRTPQRESLTRIRMREGEVPHYFDPCSRAWLPARLNEELYGRPDKLSKRAIRPGEPIDEQIERMGTQNERRDRECTFVSGVEVVETSKGQIGVGRSQCLGSDRPPVLFETFLFPNRQPIVRCFSGVPNDGDEWVNGLLTRPSSFDPSTKTVTFVDHCRSGLTFSTEVVFELKGSRLRLLREREVVSH
jgi:hypothetical protein